MKVLSIEQMTRLKELGVDVTPKEECLIYQNVMGIDILAFTDKFQNEEVKAFTLQDVIELLPKSIIINSVKHWFCVNQNCLLTEFQVMYFDGDDSYGVIKQNKSLLQAAYNMLIWVIENGHLKTK